MPAPSPQPPKIIGAMAELLYVDPRVARWNEVQAWHSLFLTAQQAREWGISAIAIDTWQGMIQANGRDNPDWRYIDQEYKVVHDAGQKIAAMMSSHQAGVNVADNVFVDIAPHYRAEIPANPRHGDLAYKSEVGARNPALVSIWGLEYAIDDLKDFWRKFRDHYSDRADWFEEIIIGAGSAGELRLPAYDQHDRDAGHGADADWPGRGLLQISSELAQKSLREELKAKPEIAGDLEKLNQRWGLKPKPVLKQWSDFTVAAREPQADVFQREYAKLSPEDLEKHFGSLDRLRHAWETAVRSPYQSWDEVYALTRKEEVDAFLRFNRQYSLMGQDIFGWQNRSLLKAGRLLLEAAIEVFHEPGSKFVNVPLGMKIPGLHWSFMHRFPQIAAGLISTEGSDPNESLPIFERQPKSWTEAEGHGYEGFFTQIFEPLRKKYPRSKLFPIFTCAEMADCHEHCFHGKADADCVCAKGSSRGHSKPESLIRGFINLAERFKQNVRVENALADGLRDPAALKRIENAVMRSPYVTGITFLRLSDVAKSPEAQALARKLANAHLCSGRLVAQAESAAQTAPQPVH